MKMKSNYFKLAGLLFITLFISCNNDVEEQPTTSSIIEIKAKPITTQAKGNEMRATQKTTSNIAVVFTGDEIVSYNGKTGEIILKNIEKENPIDVLKKYENKLDFYKNGVLIFSLKKRIVSDIESAFYNEPILHYSSIEDNKFYIRDGYPWGLPIDDVTTEREGQALLVAKERKTNAEKILASWKQFVDELKKEGKYIAK